MLLTFILSIIIYDSLQIVDDLNDTHVYSPKPPVVLRFAWRFHSQKSIFDEQSHTCAGPPPFCVLYAVHTWNISAFRFPLGKAGEVKANHSCSATY